VSGPGERVRPPRSAIPQPGEVFDKPIPPTLLAPATSQFQGGPNSGSTTPFLRKDFSALPAPSLDTATTPLSQQAAGQPRVEPTEPEVRQPVRAQARERLREDATRAGLDP